MARDPIVAFGDTQSSYFFCFPGEDPRCSGLHDDLSERMGGQGASEKRAEYPYYLSLWRDKMYVAGYKRHKDREMSSDRFKVQYKLLYKWLENNYNTRTFSTTRVALGSDGCFWACSDVGYRWNNLPTGMEEAMQAGLRLKGPIRELPTGGALGKDNAWVLTYDNELPQWSADVASYAVLWEILSCAGRRLAYVSMTALARDLFFVLFSDKSAMWCVPTAWSFEIQAAADRYYERYESPDPDHTPISDTVARKTSFSRGSQNNVSFGSTQVNKRGRPRRNSKNFSRAKSQ